MQYLENVDKLSRGHINNNLHHGESHHDQVNAAARYKLSEAAKIKQNINRHATCTTYHKASNGSHTMHAPLNSELLQLKKQVLCEALLIQDYFACVRAGGGGEETERAGFLGVPGHCGLFDAWT